MAVPSCRSAVCGGLSRFLTLCSWAHMLRARRHVTTHSCFAMLPRNQSTKWKSKKTTLHILRVDNPGVRRGPSFTVEAGFDEASFLLGKKWAWTRGEPGKIITSYDTERSEAAVKTSRNSCGEETLLIFLLRSWWEGVSVVEGQLTNVFVQQKCQLHSNYPENKMNIMNNKSL